MPRQKCRTARFRKQTRHRDLPSTRTAPAATAACAGSLTRVRRTKPAARFPQKPPKQSRSLVPSRKARIARSPTRSPRAKDFATPPPAKMRSAQARIATPVKAGALLADRPSDTIPPRGHRSPTKSPASSSFAPGKIFPCAATLCFAESTRPPEDVPKSPVRGAKRVSRTPIPRQGQATKTPRQIPIGCRWTNREFHERNLQCSYTISGLPGEPRPRGLPGAQCLIPITWGKTVPFTETLPSGLCAALWQVNVQVFVAWLYEMGAPLFWPTTFTSKLINRSPVTLGFTDPIPCAVWHTEQENPSLEMCRPCCAQLALEITLFRSWHFAHMA